MLHFHLSCHDSGDVHRPQHCLSGFGHIHHNRLMSHIEFFCLVREGEYHFSLALFSGAFTVAFVTVLLPMGALLPIGATDFSEAFAVGVAIGGFTTSNSCLPSGFVVNETEGSTVAVTLRDA
jgi:hypothetical protein